MYADIYPCVRLPRHFDYLTYSVPKELQPQLSAGQFVEIPFRKKRIFGIIAGLHDEKPRGYTTQPVLAAAESSPSWSKPHLEVLINAAQSLYLPPAALAFALAPSIPQKKRSLSDETRSESLFTVPSALKNLSASTAAPAEGSVNMVRSLDEKAAAVKKILESTANQILLLVPRQIDGEEWHAFFQAQGVDALLWEANAAKNEQWKRWQDAKNARIVITTRSGIFLPLQKLSAIIIDSPEEEEHKSWEASPHYDARTLARELAHEADIPLYCFSTAPRAEFSLPLQPSRFEPLPIHVMHHSKKDELLHEEAKNAISKSLDQKKHAVIIAVSKTKKKTVKCLDCGRDWLCPEHGSLHLGDDTLYCLVCDRREPIPTYCPGCRGQRLRGFGMGTAGLSDALKTDFPAILTVNAETLDTVADLISPHVIISTPGLLKRLYQKTNRTAVGAVLVFSPEDLLFLPTYRANERFYRHLQVHRQEAFDYFGVHLQIQTSLPDTHSLLNTAISADDKAFLLEELKARKQLRYPPFARLLTVTWKFADQPGLEKRKAEITSLLRDLTDERVMGPYLRYRSQKPYALSWQIVQTKQAAPSLDKIDKSLYSKAIVDINPEEIL